MRRRIQAFKQAPWRTQIRLTGGTMLPLIALLIVGGMYLAVNARRAQAGRQVLVLQQEQAELERMNADLTAMLAELTSPEQMLERALSLGYRPAKPGEVEYILVEGYPGPPVFVAPRPPASSNMGEGMLSPAYTETLGEWLLRWLSWGGGGGQ
ncbi:MAG: hypothetical protein E3J37_00195 [Anaerolineales bacterium]|nr:MAG: hypothetical protein E3J37_00195 [Anaerolineales bacterium]